MAQVTGWTAQEIEEELNETIVSGYIDPATSHLMLRTRAGTVMDLGAVGADAGTTVDWSNILNKPTTFQPKTYVHVQDAAAAVWTITHNLGYYPSVTIVDSAGSEVVGDITYPDQNTVTATFGGAFGGRAYLS